MVERVLVCLCTHRRHSVLRTLTSLSRLRAPEGCEITIVVIDNDRTPSARDLIRGATRSWPVKYRHAPAHNISVARTAGLATARTLRADWLAFIDDDEIAQPDWLCQLMATARATGADVVSGPARALYPPEASDWMRDLDLHSNRPVLRAGATLQTAHTSNALVRFAGTAWQDIDFDPALGTTGGEDTAWFFELSRRGASFAICPEAELLEPVASSRLSFRWLARRRFRMGRSHAIGARRPVERLALVASAVPKAIYCGLRAALGVTFATRRNFWLLRGLLHAGAAVGAALPRRG
ncbi:glycosyltransferase family 2 protein [Pelagovum pacificum]|uniref:Glycosyltransferase family 2 protein n=1 Tax=Pelagovum pacificum TaxID=2588711 RepID=A0A5C5G9H1_9RHOB|nr:glycosyltransferase family 2 protein [Pelagovum pacificum]QQA41931.1 glycosyltransferase family 2 protein [Pelagovum pacificum]TNY30630.1 glycosyltransferase family 2 protein [Pelagovum pacificum]